MIIQHDLKSGPGAHFNAANESLEAIMQTLRPQKGQRILSIGGSGDQALALASSGAQVVAVDNDKRQIGFMEERFLQLKGGELHVYTGNTIFDKYAENLTFFERNLSAVMANAGNIEVIRGNIYLTLGIWDAVYLSNSSPYSCVCDEVKHEGQKDFLDFIESLSSGTRLFVTAAVSSINDHREIYDFNVFHPIFSPEGEKGVYDNPRLVVNEALTEVAVSLEREGHERYWLPIVYDIK